MKGHANEKGMDCRQKVLDWKGSESLSDKKEYMEGRGGGGMFQVGRHTKSWKSTLYTGTGTSILRMIYNGYGPLEQMERTSTEVILPY